MYEAYDTYEGTVHTDDVDDRVLRVNLQRRAARTMQIINLAGASAQHYRGHA